MKRIGSRLLFVMLLSIMVLPSTAQDWPLVYETDFSRNSISDFEFTDPNAWRLNDSLSNRYLELYRQSDYQARVRSPYSVAIIKDVEVGSFVLEADLLQTGREYGHRDMCVFFGAKDPSNFYYVHFASAADPNAHNIFLVNDEPRVSFADETTSGIQWGTEWTRIKIIRDRKSGSIEVYFGNMDTPIMKGNDTHFDFGHIGFGSFDDTGKVDNVRIWGEIRSPNTGFFDY